MVKNSLILVLLFFFTTLGFSQNPVCPSPLVYMDGGPFIRVYDPSQLLSATNPSATNIPTFGGGLTLMPSINGGTLCPTFYTTSGGTYWYWSGTAWVNTGHSTGNVSAVNIAGCGSTIYNLVGGTGQVYSYNGSANGTLLTTLSGFNGGGPYDLVTDCNCNFYALRAATPNQALSLYNSAGVLQNTFALVGMPNISSGGGFAIIGNNIYVYNGTFYIGTINGGTVTFNPSIPSWTGTGPSDFASCPVCTNTPVQSTVAATISGGGQLSCIVTTINISVTTTLNPINYFWTGPGIVGLATGSSIVANAAGVYTCVVSTQGCPSSQLALTSTVTSNVAPILAVISPSGNICTSNSGTLALSVAPTSTATSIFWSGPGIVSGQGAPTIITNLAGTYSVTVTNILNGCVATDAVTISPTPTLSLSLSATSLCAQPINGSVASITLTPGGATNYTLYTSANFSTSAPNGNTMPCVPVAPFSNSLSLGTATLVGSVGFCSNFVTTSFSIHPNPVVTISPINASVCLGVSQAYNLNGAAAYNWSGPSGLNSYSGANVIASTSVTSAYSFIGSSLGCNSATGNTTLTILPIPTVSVVPSSTTICLGSVANLSAIGTANSFTWFPNTGLSSNTGAFVNASPPVTKLYTVLGVLNTCTNTATALVTIVNPPTLTLSLSSNTVCEYNYNGSANTISVIPAGASTYTLLNGTNYSAVFPTGTGFQIVPIGLQNSGVSLATATLIGKLSVCTVSTTKTFSILPNPLLSISPTATNICPGKNQVFQVVGATTYSWIPSQDLNTFSGNLILATPIISNIYSVIGSSVGCHSNTHNANLTVLPIPIVSVSPNTPTICAGNSVSLTASGNASFYNWSPPIGLSAVTGTVVTASPLSTQNYIVIGYLNTCTNSAIATVSTIVVPVLTATASQYTVCSGASTNLTALGATAFNWSPSNSLNFPTGNAVVASPYNNTTYTVNGFNGICTGSTSIFIQTVPIPTMKIVASENQICDGASLTIGASGANSFSWTPSLGLSNTTGSLVYASPHSTTNYTVIGSNSTGTVICYQQMSYSVLVVPTTLARVSNSVILCEGEKTTLTASGGNTYSWTPNFGLNKTNSNAVVANPSVTTIYSVRVGQNSFCSSNATVAVNVNPKPTVFAGRDTIYNLDEPIYLNASGTGTLTWISGNEILCKVCPFTKIITDRDECYVIEAINEFDCKVQDKVCIQVTSEFAIYIPNSFTPNNDQLNDVFYVFGNNIFNFNMEIYDRWGHTLFSSKDQSIGWDGTDKGLDCKSGNYVYKLEYKGLNGKRYTKSGNVTLIR